MINPDEYVKALLTEIEQKKTSGLKGFFRLNDRVPDYVVDYAKNYFAVNTSYSIEFRKCKSCLGTWDLLVFF